MTTRRPLQGIQYPVELGLGTPSHIYALAKVGIIPAVRIGRRVMFDPDALDRFIEAGGAALPGGWRREPIETNAA